MIPFCYLLGHDRAIPNRGLGAGSGRRADGGTARGALLSQPAVTLAAQSQACLAVYSRAVNVNRSPAEGFVSLNTLPKLS
jgi:hypothetical protein